MEYNLVAFPEVWLVFLFLMLLICAAVIIGCRLYSWMYLDVDTKPTKDDSVHLVESIPSQCSSLDLDLSNLRFEDSIYNGRFGSVCKGTLNGQPVAIKVYTSQRKKYLNEKDVYSLQLMNHISLPQFFGAEERNSAEGIGRTCLIILSYAPLGCLQDYLRRHTVNWMIMCKLIQTLTAGLAYLHSEIRKGDKYKPSIAHRDLSSRNILVKEDLSSMICDFGFAVKISGSKCIVNGRNEISTLSDVGTLNYLPPEVLDGAINLRNCESSLKQIDVYALGLILWEIGTRCSDLYQGLEVPQYKIPFENELGRNPSYEQMQVLVSRYKARPLFPDIWKDTNIAIRQLKETIEDCWDHDADARLTSPCVEERLAELPTLWDRHKNGTVSSAIVGCLRLTGTQNSAVTSINNQRSVLSLRHGTLGFHNAVNSNNPMDNEKQTNRINLSTCQSNSTLVTMISPSSDSEKNVILAANAFNYQTPRVSLPLQPYQGRNPCLERNLMLDSSDDRNKFLQQGLKFRSNHDPVNNFFETFVTEGENHALVANDVLNRTINVRPERPIPGNNPLPRIPFVQNEVNMVIPKQLNISVKQGHRNPPSNLETKADSLPWKLFKWTKSSALKSFFDRRNTNEKKDCDVAEERQPMVQPLSSPTPILRMEVEDNSTSPIEPSDFCSSMISSIDAEKNDNILQKETKVQIVNGSTTTSLIDYNVEQSSTEINCPANDEESSVKFNIIIDESDPKT